MGTWTLVEGTLSDGLIMRLCLAERDGRICGSSLSDDEHGRTEDEFLRRMDRQLNWERVELGAGPDVLRSAAAQVRDYFAGRGFGFDVPLTLRGTEFQIRVWDALTRIPFGETRSYGDIAGIIGQPSAPRAVGGANGRNRLPVFVPCHRVLAAGGKLGGFTGGIGLKKRLLAHEAAVLLRQSTAA